MVASAPVHAPDPFPDLEPAHCRAVCREIGERLQQDLKPHAGPMPARLEWLLRRLEDAA